MKLWYKWKFTLFGVKQDYGVVNFFRLEKECRRETHGNGCANRPPLRWVKNSLSHKMITEFSHPFLNASKDLHITPGDVQQTEWLSHIMKMDGIQSSEYLYIYKNHINSQTKLFIF